MAKPFKRNLLHRVVNPLTLGLLRLGLGLKQSRALTVTGRKSGREYTTPVNLVFRDGKRYLVSPYGTKGWAMNARAAGKVTLSRGRKREEVAIREMPPAEAGPVLRQYYDENAITHPYFDVTAESTDAEFAAEAPLHPVFLLDPLWLRRTLTPEV